MSTPSSVQALQEQREELQRQLRQLEIDISAAHREKRAEVIGKIKAMMLEHHLNVSDLSFGRRSSPNPTAGASKLAGRSVPPKYRNIATGETWSGRGHQPKWLKTALASGRSISDFALA